MANNEVDTIVLTVAPVSIVKGDKTIGSASGFFYALGEVSNAADYFFVTNRHVVENPDNRTPYDALRLTLHTDRGNIRSNSELTLPLLRGGSRTWKCFDDAEIDIALIPVQREKITKGGFFVRAFSAAALPPSDLQIGLGEDVLVVGYPLGFYDTINNLPIFRRASVASVYPVPFRGKPFFLVDSRLHPGTSGSPVVLKPSSLLQMRDRVAFMSKPSTYLLGIHSHTWPLPQWVPQGTEPYGLNAVWFGSLIEQLASR